MAPVQRVDGADDDALVLIDATSGRRRPAGRRQPDRRLLLRPAEVVRLGRWPLAGPVLPRRPGAGRGDHGIRPLGARLLQPADGDQQQPPRPDLQHPRRRDPGHARQPGRVAQRPGRPRLGHRAHQGLLRPPLRLGRGQRLRHPLRHRPREPVAGRRDDRLRRRDRRLCDREDVARQRCRRRRAVPQARPQPAARGLLPGGRARRRQQADRLRRARRRPSSPDPLPRPLSDLVRLAHGSDAPRAREP